MLLKILLKFKIEARNLFLLYFRVLPPPAKIFLAILNRQFWHSNISVMEGISQHLKTDKEKTGNRFRLRRYTHMFEKGLSHRHQKSEFGVNYIGRAVDQYSKLLSNSSPKVQSEIDELQWATDVLKRYFDFMGENTNSDYQKARSLFLSIQNKPDDKGFAPFLRKVGPMPDIDQLIALGNRRRSVRFYQNSSVEIEKIANAFSFATLAPSACNRQPFKIHYFDNKEKVDAVSSLAPGAVSFASGIPAIAVIVGDLSAYEFEKDRTAIYVDSSMASMCFILGLEAQGLSSCCLNWPEDPGLNKKANKLLGLKPYQRIIMMLAIGYPDETVRVPFSQKRKPQEFGGYNSEIYRS